MVHKPNRNMQHQKEIPFLNTNSSNKHSIAYKNATYWLCVSSP